MSDPIWEHPPRPPWVKGINAVGGVLRRVGVRWPKVDAQAMMASSEITRRCRRSAQSDHRSAKPG